VFIPFVLANLLAVGLNTGIMPLALDTFGWPEVSALALATTMTFLWNFIANKFYIFK
jgi:putative flippase GtrA